MNEDKMHKDFEDWSETAFYSRVARGEDGEYTCDDAVVAWQAWQAATRAAVPAGWKVVPLDPTPEMIIDAHASIGSCMGSCGEASPPDASDIADALRSAIEAAPEVKP